MKKLLVLLFCCVGFLYVLAQPSGKPRRMPGTEGKDPHPEAKKNSPLPVFQLIDANRKTWTNKNIPAQHQVIFAMFNPGCSHCDDFGALIHRLQDSLKNTTVIMMTFEENFKELKAFLQKSGLDQQKNVHVGICNNSFILGHFMPGYTIPQVMIYSKQKKLKKVLYEAISSQDLLPYLGAAG